MSQITSTDPRDQVIGYTGDVIARQLREGNAPVVQSWKTNSLLTWCFVPADSDNLAGVTLRDFNRAEVELGARVTGLMGGLIEF